MGWTYDNSDLATTTASGRLNAVRLLVGDTDTTDQQVQDEEITFALSEAQDNVYFAASWIAKTISSKYGRRVDTKLDGQLSAMYSQLHRHYQTLSVNLDQQGKKYSGSSLGVKYGGLKISEVNSVRDDTNRVTPSFRRDRFKYPDGDYIGDYTDE